MVCAPLNSRVASHCALVMLSASRFQVDEAYGLSLKHCSKCGFAYRWSVYQGAPHQSLTIANETQFEIPAVDRRI